jgi:hypothetical protein
MKRILIATALSLATVGAASAMTAPNGLSNAAEFEVRQLVPGADVSGLTTSQVGMIEHILSSPDFNSAGDNAAGAIKAVLSRAS